MGTACGTEETGICAIGTSICLDGATVCQPDRLPEGEQCNAIDDDCDGHIDENLLNACGFCGLLPQERCDDIDNDCDGLIDETHQCPNDHKHHYILHPVSMFLEYKYLLFVEHEPHQQHCCYCHLDRYDLVD